MMIRMTLGDLRMLLHESLNDQLHVGDEVVWSGNPGKLYNLSWASDCPTSDYDSVHDGTHVVISRGDENSIPLDFWVYISAFDGRIKPNAAYVKAGEIRALTEVESEVVELQDTLERHFSFDPVSSRDLAVAVKIGRKHPELVRVSPDIEPGTAYRALTNLSSGDVMRLTNGRGRGAYSYVPTVADTSWARSFDFVKRWILPDAKSGAWCAVMTCELNNGSWIEVVDHDKWGIPVGELVCAIKPNNVRIAVTNDLVDLEKMIVGETT